MIFGVQTFGVVLNCLFDVVYCFVLMGCATVEAITLFVFRSFSELVFMLFGGWLSIELFACSTS